jgi:hypothetical protein
LYYERDLGKHPVPPGRDHINRQALRACSYDPAYRDVSLTDDLASYLFSYKILHRVHMRKRAGPLAEISFEFAEIIGRRDENFSI